MAWVTTYVCRTNEYWETTVQSSGGRYTYKVKFEPLSRENMLRQKAQYGWTCSCVGYKYRGICRHVRETMESRKRCGWNAELDPGAVCAWSEQGHFCCPQCGGPVSTYQVEVK